jgi:hypothetical protein
MRGIRLQNTNDKRFIFSAYANTLSAVLQQPAKAFLSDAPSAATPTTGGLSSHSKENISLMIESHEVLRTGRVSTTVLAEQRGNNYVTLATSTVENLNILDVITADAIVSRIVSVFPADGNRLERCGSDDHPALFHLARSRFENLKIDGKLRECKLDRDFGSEDGFFVKECVVKPQRGSLFAEGCREFRIPHFGAIHAGQVDSYGGKVILTMLRVELGCPIVGTVSVCDASTNGGDG